MINRVLADLSCLPGIENCQVIIAETNDFSHRITPVDNINLLITRSRPGRAAQMNKAVEYAESDILLFLHSDTKLPSNAVDLVTNSVKNKKYAAGAFSLKFDTERKSLKFIAAMTTLRSKLTGVPYGDQGIFVPKDVFEKVNGYTDLSLLEDVDLIEKIKKNGGKVKILQEFVCTSPRKYLEQGVIKRVSINRLIMLLYFFGVSPHKIARMYR